MTELKTQKEINLLDKEYKLKFYPGKLCSQDVVKELMGKPWNLNQSMAVAITSFVQGKVFEYQQAERQEAINWVKHLQKPKTKTGFFSMIGNPVQIRASIAWIKHNFNITREELK